MRRLTRFFLLLLGSLWSGLNPGFATEPDDPAWRSFQHGLGAPAYIGANAEHPAADTVFRPLPPPSFWRINADKFTLGFRLFHESRLATGNGIACVTCHAGTLSGADRRVVSIGVGGAAGKMNALSVFNAAFSFRQFWDGRAVTLENQALLPIATDFEMANTLEAVREFLGVDSEYTTMFQDVYPDGVTIANMADALAHYQRSTFIRLDTPFQRYLGGEQDALTELEQQGLRRFTEVGCSHCHNGINLGGNSYQKLGALRAYYGVAETADIDDAGLAARTGIQGDLHVFRVPGLHGVATTPPYLHDGSVISLEDTVKLMAEFQLGRKLEESDVEAIAAFLRSLGGHFNSSRTGLPATTADLESAQRGWQLDTGPEAIAADHEAAYLETLEAFSLAQDELLDELAAVTSGEVEHFDFAQFQHLELIRYASALSHPPSSLPQGLRETISIQAQELHDRVISLELEIADLLQETTRIDAFEKLLLSGDDASHRIGNEPLEPLLQAAKDRSEQSLLAIETAVNKDLAALLSGLRAHLQ